MKNIILKYCWLYKVSNSVIISRNLKAYLISLCPKLLLAACGKWIGMPPALTICRCVTTSLHYLCGMALYAPVFWLVIAHCLYLMFCNLANLLCKDLSHRRPTCHLLHLSWMHIDPKNVTRIGSMPHTLCL